MEAGAAAMGWRRRSNRRAAQIGGWDTGRRSDLNIKLPTVNGNGLQSTKLQCISKIQVITRNSDLPTHPPSYPKILPKLDPMGHFPQSMGC
jgi:hypothetical protein